MWAFTPVVLLVTVLASPALANRMAVIVHTDRVVHLDLEQIAQIYLKRRRFWAGGDAMFQ